MAILSSGRESCVWLFIAQSRLVLHDRRLDDINITNCLVTVLTDSILDIDLIRLKAGQRVSGVSISRLVPRMILG